jgi:hypothetical protein
MRHEIRLRAPFDPLPYSVLINASERFFDYIVALRQSSLFYRPHFIGDDSEAAMDLLGHRRDAIASVLSNLYVLSGALRSNREVLVSYSFRIFLDMIDLMLQKYLPNAAVARKHLLDRMLGLEREHTTSRKYSSEERRQEMKLGYIYRYSYNESLTG